MIPQATSSQCTASYTIFLSSAGDELAHHTLPDARAEGSGLASPGPCHPEGSNSSSDAASKRAASPTQPSDDPDWGSDDGADPIAPQGKSANAKTNKKGKGKSGQPNKWQAHREQQGLAGRLKRRRQGPEEPRCQPRGDHQQH